MGACAAGHLSVAQYLVDRRADINAKDNVSYDIMTIKYSWVVLLRMMHHENDDIFI